MLYLSSEDKVFPTCNMNDAKNRKHFLEYPHDLYHPRTTKAKQNVMAAHLRILMNSLATMFLFLLVALLTSPPPPPSSSGAFELTIQPLPRLMLQVQPIPRLPEPFYSLAEEISKHIGADRQAPIFSFFSFFRGIAGCIGELLFPFLSHKLAVCRHRSSVLSDLWSVASGKGFRKELHFPFLSVLL